MTAKKHSKFTTGAKRRLALFFCIATIAGVLSTTGCGGSSVTSQVTPPPVVQNPNFLFVSNTSSNTVSALQQDPKTGALAVIPGSPFLVGSTPEFLAADSGGKFLFVANSGSGNVSVFQINGKTGALSAVTGSPFASGGRPEGVAVDPAGKFVFVANQASSNISVFSVGADGTLTAISGSPFPANNPFGLAINPAGTVLYANNFPDSQAFDFNTVSAFQIGSDGRLTPVSGSPFATASAPGFASSVGLAADPGGKFLFVADHMAQAVVPFQINATNGSLTPASTLPTPPAACGASCHNNPLRVAVHPNSQFVYATNVQAGTVSAFGVVSSSLSAISDFPAGQHPFGVAFDPTGSFLYVVNKVDGSLSGFSVSATTGMLTPLSGFPVSPGLAAPTDLVIVASH